MRNDVKSTTWSSLKLIYFSAIVIKDDLSSHLFLIFYFDWRLMGKQEHNSLLLFFHRKKNKILKMNLPVGKVYVNTRNCASRKGVIYHIMIEYLQNKNRKDSPVVHEKKNWEKIQPFLRWKLRWILSDWFSIRIHLTRSP